MIFPPLILFDFFSFLHFLFSHPNHVLEAQISQIDLLRLFIVFSLQTNLFLSLGFEIEKGIRIGLHWKFGPLFWVIPTHIWHNIEHFKRMCGLVDYHERQIDIIVEAA